MIHQRGEVVDVRFHPARRRPEIGQAVSAKVVAHRADPRSRERLDDAVPDPQVRSERIDEDHRRAVGEEPDVDLKRRVADLRKSHARFSSRPAPSDARHTTKWHETSLEENKKFTRTAPRQRDQRDRVVAKDVASAYALPMSAEMHEPR